MSYAAIAALISGKRPYWLYRLALGSDVVHLTSRASDIADTAPAQVWTASAIRHGRLRQTGSLDRSGVELTLPRSDAFAQKVRDSIGIAPTEVTIWHGYENDPAAERVVKFTGRIVAVTPTLTSVTLSCQSRFTILRRKALSATMQRLCRHAHYHDPGAGFAGCKLALAEWQVTATAAAWADPRATVAEAAAHDDGFFTGGIFEYAGDRQLILAHAGDQLRLLAPLAGLAEQIAANGAAAVKLAPGCNLSFEMCSGLFRNSDNFGGFPQMTDTPFDGRNPYWS